MLFRQIKTQPRFCRLRTVRIVVLSVLWWPVANAAADPSRWRMEPSANLRFVSSFEFRDGRSASIAAVGGHLGLELASPDHPFAAGLFADRERAISGGLRDVTLAGGWLRYRYGRWHMSMTAANVAARHADGLWLYAGELKFEAVSGHKLALKGIGAVRGDSRPAAQLLYETNLTRRLSVSVCAGLGSRRFHDLEVRMNFGWDVL